MRVNGLTHGVGPGLSRPWNGRRSAGDEAGAVAIVVALLAVVLFVAAALVVDLGRVRVDRQFLKSTADSAVLSGMAAGDALTGDVYSYRAVCGALDTLRSNAPFQANGAYAGLPNGVCANLAANVNTKCDPSSPSVVKYDQTVTYQGTTYRAVIQSPVNLASQGFSEESLSAVSGDQSQLGGCDQLSIELYETREPGLGAIAITGDVGTAVRSAGRVLVGGEDATAPALLVLERSACSVLTIGSATNGSILVKGIGGTPGSIHLDTAGSGSDCLASPGKQALQGKHADGIVAYGSPSPTGTAGSITAVAAYNNVAANVIVDSSTNVYATTSVSGTGTNKLAVTGRPLIGRQVIDTRYRSGIQNQISTALPVWGTSAPSGWTTAGCSPTAAQLANTGKLWIDCTANSGITLTPTAPATAVTIQASEVYFNGFIKGGSISMPNATKVYVSNTTSSGVTINADAVGFSNGNAFCVRAATCNPSAPTTGTCPTTSTTSRARVFIRRGTLAPGGGLLRMCNTTLVMLSGDRTTGCVPTTSNPAPTTSPCTSTPTTGNGTVSVGGQATVDWSAPNEYAGSIPAANRATAWSNGEDLAMWSESSGTFTFSGGGSMNTVGVYMVPNGNVTLGGGTSQILTNAQYIARTIATGGQGSISLTTDPRNAVTIPASKGFSLVR